jgi:hypothetical protein
VGKEKHDNEFGRNTREVWNIKHSANIAEIESLKHTKSYHIRRCEHRTLCENEDPTWRHYSYSDTQKKTIVHLIKYVMLTGKLILLESQPCQWHYLRNLQYSCLCQFTQQTSCEYVVLILYASLFHATLHIWYLYFRFTKFRISIEYIKLHLYIKIQYLKTLKIAYLKGWFVSDIKCWHHPSVSVDFCASM